MPRPRVANSRGAIGRITGHTGYAGVQSRRPVIECIFGWGKLHSTLRKTDTKASAAVAGDLLLHLIAYNLVRISKPVGS
jgi:hypothetical protein